jgi:putative nucleotidyltransferase with HDIG domain
VTINRELRLYIAALCASACGLALLLVVMGVGLGEPWVVLALALASIVAERHAIRFSATTELSISPVLALFAAVLLGPLAGGLVGAASELGDRELLRRGSKGRSPYLKAATYTSSRFISGAAMGAVASAVMHWIPSEAGVLVATVAGSLTGEALEVAFAAIAGRLRGSSTAVIRLMGPLMVTATCVYAPVVAALTFAYTEISPWTALLFLAPGLAAQALFAMYTEKATLYEEQVKLSDELRKTNESLYRAIWSFAEALVEALDASDEYTAGHSSAVAIYSRDIAKRMGFSEDEQDRAYLCGLVHDIGKIGVDPEILRKPGRLTLEERRNMERHSEIGYQILRKIDEYSDIALVVLYHHERMDGEGYPKKLTGPDIPMLSRIIAVADAYNAMTSNRPYRDAMNYLIARDRLLQAMGAQFDSDVVIAFAAVLADEDDDYRYARRSDFRTPGAFSPDPAAVLIAGAA